MMNLRPSHYERRIAAVSGFLLAFLVIIAGPPQANAQGTPPAAKTPDAIVHVKGMACKACARTVTNALEKLDAVEEAVVQLQQQRALLTLKAGKTVTREILRATVEGAGYQFRKVVFSEEKRDASASASEAPNTM